MEIGTKTIAAGVGIFLLGVGSTYWLMSNKEGGQPPAQTNAVTQYQPSEVALAGVTTVATTGVNEPASYAEDHTTAGGNEALTLTHERFLADAEVRREQQLAEKAEADRLNKLRHIKEDSVDCKFWRQQKQTSSTAAKVEEKIQTHCLLPSDRITATSSSPAEAI